MTRRRTTAWRALAAALLSAAGIAPAFGWPTAPGGVAGTYDPSDCEDLSSQPIRHDIYYSMDDHPPGTDPNTVTTILEDVFNFGGGCTGCHNGSSADGGLLRLNAPSSVLRIVFQPSYGNLDLLRARPNDPEASMVYTMLNCVPTAPYPTMPPSMTGDRIAIGLRAFVYDWIASGARGRDEDGNDVSDVLFRDQIESDRLQRFLIVPPPP